MKKNNRHLIAFIVTTMVYGVAIGSIIGFDTQEKVQVQLKEPAQTVKIAVFRENTTQNTQEKITPKESKIIEKKEIVEKKIEPKIVEKVEKIIEKPLEKIVEEKPKIIEHKVEKVVEVKQTFAPPQPHKEPLPQPTPVVKQQVSQQEIPKIVKSEINTQEIQNKKREYFSLVKNMIDKNKYYPQNALRRGIECDIKVKFTISSMGEFLSLEMIEGNKIFHNSVKEAIEKSFPLLPPKNILKGNEVLSLVISYTIN